MNWRVRWEDILFGSPEKNKKLERQGSKLSLVRVRSSSLVLFAPFSRVILRCAFVAERLGFVCILVEERRSIRYSVSQGDRYQF